MKSSTCVLNWRTQLCCCTSVIQTWRLLPCWVSSFLGSVVQLANKLCLKWPNFLKCCDASVLLHYINMLCFLHPFLPVHPWSETGKISNGLIWYCAINSLSREDYRSANCNPEKLIWLSFGIPTVFVWMPLQHTQKAPKDCIFQTILIWTWVASYMFSDLPPTYSTFLNISGEGRERTAGKWSYVCFSCWTLNFLRCRNDT